MLWYRQPYTVGILASVMVSFGAIGGIVGGVSKPKVDVARCQVEKAVLEQIQQCPADSVVYSQGKELGQWTGFELKK